MKFLLSFPKAWVSFSFEGYIYLTGILLKHAANTSGFISHIIFESVCIVYDFPFFVTLVSFLLMKRKIKIKKLMKERLAVF